MNSNLYLIIRREYLERVRRKSFIITTILMPLFMILMMALPALMMLIASPEETRIAVVDNSNLVGESLKNSGEVTFARVNIPVDSAKVSPDYDAVLVIGPDIVNNPNDVVVFSHESMTVQTESLISDEISNIIRDIRLQKYDIENLDKILAEVDAKVSMTTFIIDEDAEKQTSSLASYLIGMIMTMTLYMFIIIYGQMVMTSIIEEKNNRVLEVVVSSVNPNALMLGKILGIAAVAVTQIVIWALLVLAFVVWGMPAISSSVTGGADTASELLAVISMLGDPSYIMGLFGYMALFLVGGFLFYAAIYAAIGSSVDNIQDASQLQSVALVPILLALILSITIVNDPHSTLAMWASVIPFTSPMVMMARMPFGVPVWQSVLSLVILYLSVLATVWLSAKIYRVGIFMYGKKPSFRDLIRWARYK